MDPLPAEAIDWGPLQPVPAARGLMPASWRAEDLLWADLLALEQQGADLASTLVATQTLVHEALDRVQQLMAERDRLRAGLARERDQHRHLREQLLRDRS